MTELPRLLSMNISSRISDCSDNLKQMKRFTNSSPIKSRMNSAAVIQNLKECADASKAAFFPRFFKCAPGEYGYGDRFLGVTVPKSRKIAATFAEIQLSEIQNLLNSQWHEARLTGLLILVARYKKADLAEQKKLFMFYCKNLNRVNNWDLVDSSAPYIMGPYLYSQSVHTASGKKSALLKLDSLAQSKNIWERRASILSTFYFIRQGEFFPTLRIAEKLLNDPHDLIHKAVGWMLREVGKYSKAHEVSFLDAHHSRMPRTMLRYAIEKIPEGQRMKYLAR